MKEIEVSGRGKELDFSQGRKESLEVRFLHHRPNYIAKSMKVH